MTREDLLEIACKTLLATARKTVVAQERWDHWSQFGTDSATERRAAATRDRLLDQLEHAEDMARFALRGNVTLFLEASQRYRDAARKP
jgi:hypothetical protein